MLSPEDVKKLGPDNERVTTWIEKIDNSIKYNHGLHEYVYAKVPSVLTADICNCIAKKYIDAGWNYVYYNILGNIMGRTQFKFSLTPIRHTNIESMEHWICITKKDGEYVYDLGITNTDETENQSD